MRRGQSSRDRARGAGEETAGVTVSISQLLLAPYLGKLMTKDHVACTYMSTARVKRYPIFVAWEISDRTAQQDSHGPTVLCACATVLCRVMVFTSLWPFPQPWVPRWLPAILLSVVLLTLLHTPKPPSSQSSVLPQTHFWGSGLISFSIKKSKTLQCEFFFCVNSHADISLVWEEVPLLPSKASPCHVWRSMS